MQIKVLKKLNSMFFSFAILSLCIFSFKVVASAEYNLEIINFKQLVHAINIGWAHENKFKLHKNVSLIKFRAIKIRPLSFSRTLLARSAFWLTEMSMRQREQLRVSKKFAVFVSRPIFRQKNKNMYLFWRSLFNQTNYHFFQHFRPDSPPQRVTPRIMSTCSYSSP